ncbi:MAG TPA: glycogen synthase [Anaerolineaceae bacterium]|nr:glycogen synthase [Anaerolineaceae bacterium]HQH57432.1 glycogen synthase [Anaerolineaceae bacterium]
MKTLNVLFLAAEADPLVKVGGLGDVAGSLPLALRGLPAEAHTNCRVDVRLLLPYHDAVRQKLPSPDFLFSFPVESKTGARTAEVFQSEVNGVPLYLIGGEPIANSPVYSPDSAADGRKYVFFSAAALKLLERQEWKADIVHANDWHTALVVYLLSLRRKASPAAWNPKTIFTMHNLPFMGAGTDAAFDDYGIPPSRYSLVPWWGKKFPLPLAVQTADRVTTVSKTYAQEILTPEFGCGLEKLLQTRHKVVSGIVNGLDMDAWDPSADARIPASFSAETLDQRAANKEALAREFDLDTNPAVPLLVLVSRMDQQKGVDLAVEGLASLADRDWQAILLGTGNPDLEDACRKLESALPKRVRAAIRFDVNLSRRMYAGGDILLMPSRYEPCGLAQMMAMRYGCIPLARATGGLQDTISDISANPESGTGFLFKPAAAEDFAGALTRALDLFKDRQAWQAMQKRGMRQDFSWSKSALEYLRLYQSLGLR